jgi:polysaccharide chain length determinant protein (PEP-CTERM system associated)
LAAAKDRQIQLQQQLNQLTSTSSTVVVEGQVMAVEPDVNHLETMKEQLSVLRTRYTEAHPDVISLKAKISKLEKKLAARKLAGTGEAGSRPAASRVNSPAYIEISNQLSSVKREINQLQRELKRLRSEIDTVNAKVENAPKREAELVALTRDYGNLHQNYQNLLDRKIEAQLAENLEMQQQGEQFKVLDPAQLPVKPFKPDRRKILLAGMVLGLGIGIGLALLLDFLGKSYRYVPDIEEDLGFQVLVTIPRILTEKELKWRKIRNVAGTLVVCMAMLAAGGLGYMYFKLTFSLTSWFQQTFFQL